MGKMSSCIHHKVTEPGSDPRSCMTANLVIAALQEPGAEGQGWSWRPGLEAEAGGWSWRLEQEARAGGRGWS